MFIGVDVGGTNTDAVLMDGSQLMGAAKAPTTADVTSGIVAAIAELLAQNPRGVQVDAVMVGTTHFTNALRLRLSPADSSGLPDRGPRAESLLLWGGLDTRGKPFLEPAFVVDAPPTLPGSGAEYRLAGHSSAGNELFALSFDMPEVADGGGGTGFAFVLPAETGWAGNLARITLSGPGGSVRLDGDSDLGLAIVRDPRNGQVRAILRDAAESAEAQAEEVAGRSAFGDLEVILSRGIPEAWRR